MAGEFWGCDCSGCPSCDEGGAGWSDGSNINDGCEDTSGCSGYDCEYAARPSAASALACAVRRPRPALPRCADAQANEPRLLLSHWASLGWSCSNSEDYYGCNCDGCSCANSVPNSYGGIPDSYGGVPDSCATAATACLPAYPCLPARLPACLPARLPADLPACLPACLRSA